MRHRRALQMHSFVYPSSGVSDNGLHMIVGYMHPELGYLNNHLHARANTPLVLISTVVVNPQPLVVAPDLVTSAPWHSFSTIITDLFIKNFGNPLLSGHTQRNLLTHNYRVTCEAQAVEDHPLGGVINAQFMGFVPQYRAADNFLGLEECDEPYRLYRVTFDDFRQITLEERSLLDFPF